jgi:integrase/recombinase XerD
MRLLAATDDLVIGGFACLGFPVLFWDSMELCVEVNAFLKSYLLRAAITSRKSWEGTGRALYDYFSFLQANELEWRDTERGEAKELLYGYIGYCFEIAKLASDTVRQRVLYVCEFYKFCREKGWIHRLPFDYEERRGSRRRPLLAHLDQFGGKYLVPDVMPRKQKRIIKYLSLIQVKALLEATTNPHHKMILRCALHTGLRREELATFPLAYVFDPSRNGHNTRNVRITLDPYDGNGMKTKGRKTRDILMGRRLMSALHDYAVHYRGGLVVHGSKIHKELFLSEDGKPYSTGGKHLQWIAGQAGKRIGLKVHTHLLRHTYATQMLVALQRYRGDARVEPLVFLQRQLGHSSIETTMRYLHAVNEIADNAVLEYDEELNSWSGAV